MRSVLVVVVVVTVACSSSPGPKSSSHATSLPTTTGASPTPSPSSVASTTTAVSTATHPVVTLPVVPCPTSYAAQPPGTPFVAHQLPAASGPGGLSFYSNGRLTALAPAGWACSALLAADGGQRLDVYPPGQPDLAIRQVPPGTQVIQVERDYTGHGPGAQLVCPLFPGSPAATFLGPGQPCPAPAAHEQLTRLTNDVVSFTDPPGVHGTGAGSGGELTTIGAAVYPQIAPEPPGGVTVNVLSCTLPAATSADCQTIEADFLVGNPPSYTPTN